MLDRLVGKLKYVFLNIEKFGLGLKSRPCKRILELHNITILLTTSNVYIPMMMVEKDQHPSVPYSVWTSFDFIPLFYNYTTDIWLQLHHHLWFPPFCKQKDLNEDGLNYSFPIANVPFRQTDCIIFAYPNSR